MEDVKDGVLKMIIFSNLDSVSVGGIRYNSIPTLKLTTASQVSYKGLEARSRAIMDDIRREAKVNNFKILFNGEFI